MNPTEIVPRKKPHRSVRKKHLLITLVLAMIGALGSQYGWFSKPTKVLRQNQPGLYTVSTFYDGDTIAVDMNGTIEKIRFIGVDTPETHDPRKAVQCFGVAAAAFTKKYIGNQAVRLESDSLSSNRDRYNRLLRYVYRPDGSLVNLEIIKAGYGFAYIGFPFSKSDEFELAEKQARDSNMGLWHDCQPTKNQYGGYTSNNAQ